MGTQYKLYGCEFSPYTGKVRAYLNYKQASYTEVFSSVLQYATVIKPRTGVMFVPVLITPEGEALQDSSVIIDTLEKRLPQRSIIPETPAQKLTCYLIELYGDEWMTPMPSMHYRWNYPENRDFLYGQFGGIALPFAPEYVKRVLGKKISQRFSGYVPKLGLTGDIKAAIEQRHEQLLASLQQHFQRYKYLLGDRPSLADFAMFGPLYAHLYRDPAAGKIMRAHAPLAVEWIERLRQPINDIGDWAAHDEIPPAILGILKMLFEDSMPLHLEAVKRVTEWADKNPGETRMPAALSGIDFELLGKKGSRILLSAPIWKLQRPLFLYQQSDDKVAMDKLLKATGGFNTMQTKVKYPVTRKNNHVVLI